MENQALKFTVSDPVESEYTTTLSNGDTKRVLEIGEFLLVKVSNGREAEELLPQLRGLQKSTGRYIVILTPGQELQKVELI